MLWDNVYLVSTNASTTIGMGVIIPPNITKIYITDELIFGFVDHKLESDIETINSDSYFLLRKNELPELQLTKAQLIAKLSNSANKYSINDLVKPSKAITN